MDSDDGREGEAVVLHGGIIDSVDLVRESNIAQALQELTEEFCLIYVDHRGVGRSDKPVEDFDYSYGLYTADLVIRAARFAYGRAGYREWACRSGRLEYIHSLDDRYDHDVDELMA